VVENGNAWEALCPQPHLQELTVRVERGQTLLSGVDLLRVVENPEKLSHLAGDFDMRGASNMAAWCQFEGLRTINTGRLEISKDAEHDYGGWWPRLERVELRDAFRRPAELARWLHDVLLAADGRVTLVFVDDAPFLAEHGGVVANYPVRLPVRALEVEEAGSSDHRLWLSHCVVTDKVTIEHWTGIMLLDKLVKHAAMGHTASSCCATAAAGRSLDPATPPT